MKKNILILDDSALMRRVLSDIINKTEEYHVAFEAANGIEGLEIIERNQVDMIFLDMHMPRMNGVEFLRFLKESDIHIPVVIISGYSKRDTKDTIEALALGAIEFVRKPENVLRDRQFFEAMILDALKYAVLAQMEIAPDILEHKARPRAAEHKTQRDAVQEVSETKVRPEKRSADSKDVLVAIACSTGGPKALQELIPMLPAGLAAPVTIVQHMPAGFTKSLADRLNQLSEIKVKEAEDNEVLENGTVYVAKGGKHLTVVPWLHEHRIAFSDAPAVNGLRPCANNMYVSLEHCGYKKIVCVVLTGMGADGTEGILQLNNSKPVYVIAQDAASSTIYGMPHAIAEAGMTDEIRPLNEIAGAIIRQVGVQ